MSVGEKEYIMSTLPDSQNPPPYLKLVVSNPPPVGKKKRSQTFDPNAGFTFEVQERRPSQYTVVAYDSFHGLDCEIPLEICDDKDILGVYDEDEMGARALLCHFPSIIDEELNEFIDGDETLCGMIIVHFQMKILEQLLLFCSNHDVSTLLVEVNHTSERHDLEIYQNLAIHEDKIPTITGMKTQLVIPATLETFDNLRGLMDDINQDFRKMLWEDQSSNPTIREYLKLNPCLKFFG